MTTAFQIALLVVFGAFGASASGAETKGKDIVQQVQKACKDDLNRLCADVTPGEGRLASCLESKEDKLSTGCREAWTDAKAKVSKRVDKTEVAFRKNCGADVGKFCADVPSGKGRLLDCLSKHEDELSGSCKKFLDDVEKKLAEFLG